MGASTPGSKLAVLPSASHSKRQRSAERSGNQHNARADLVGQRAEQARQQADTESERQEHQSGVAGVKWRRSIRSNGSRKNMIARPRINQKRRQY